MSERLPLIVALEPDLFFSVRIGQVVAASGGEALILEDGATLWEGIARWPELVLIDLSATGWEDPVRRAKSLPHTKAIPIVAFGSHVDTDALRRARQAGCDHAWARSRLMTELPQLVSRAIHPELRGVDGCDESPPLLFLQGIEQFNAGEYWECHETLETLWRAEQRPVRDVYQGILQVGVAFHHLKMGNYDGAMKVLQRALPKLRGVPEVCQSVRVAELARAARRIYDDAAALGPERIAELNLSALPKLEFER